MATIIRSNVKKTNDKQKNVCKIYDRQGLVSLKQKDNKQIINIEKKNFNKPIEK